MRVFGYFCSSLFYNGQEGGISFLLILTSLLSGIFASSSMMDAYSEALSGNFPRKDITPSRIAHSSSSITFFILAKVIQELPLESLLNRTCTISCLRNIKVPPIILSLSAMGFYYNNIKNK